MDSAVLSLKCQLSSERLNFSIISRELLLLPVNWPQVGAGYCQMPGEITLCSLKLMPLLRAEST